MATKDGYYKTEGKHWFYRRGENCVQGGRWQPRNPTIGIVLKERRSPAPMYAKRVDAAIPVQDRAVGFDLEKGDWVAPYGQGIRADLVFEYTATYGQTPSFAKRLGITFSSGQDGLQAFAFDATSEFPSMYTAPEDGYVPTLVLEYELTPGKVIKNAQLGEDKYLVCRFRTTTDKEGKITSANYGKIYGPIQYGRMGDTHRVMFTYYFNPTANDRNLEFDPARNLFGQVSRRRVSCP